MHHQSQELFLAKVKAIVKGPHASMLNELIFILDNPVNNCRNGPDDGPMGALRQIIHYIYQNFTDDMDRGLGCTYARTCLSAQEHGCTINGPGVAKVLQFRSRLG
jgi:hypothetical protein